MDLNLSDDGICIVKKCLGPELLQHLGDVFPSTLSNTRNALEIAAIRALSRSPVVRSLAIRALGDASFATRAILFNKTADSNWKVSWHQDVVIAVKERVDVPAYGPWSVKDDVAHVRPPAMVLDGMLAVRLHLDDCDENNGPLKVLLGTHKRGILSDAEIASMSKEEQFLCSVQRGDAIVMRPLLLHSSSAAKCSAARRVIHIEFASGELAPPLQWHAAVS